MFNLLDDSDGRQIDSFSQHKCNSLLRSRLFNASKPTWISVLIAPLAAEIKICKDEFLCEKDDAVSQLCVQLFVGWVLITALL